MQRRPSLLSRRGATLSGQEHETYVPPPLTEEPRNFKLQRYYRSRNASNGSSTTHPDSERGSQRRFTPLPLLRARSDAMQTLAACRTVILSLELTRMRKSRIGFAYWMAFWERIYERPLARALCSRISVALSKVDGLFQDASKELNELTWKVGRSITTAQSETEILKLLEQMEMDVAAHRRRRRKRAQGILKKLKASIEDIPVDVSDELFDDLKRGIFALDTFCDYHPGDPEAEERDRQPADEPLEVEGFVEADPQLAYRPGFGAEFYNAIERATTRYERNAYTQHFERWVNECDQDCMQWQLPDVNDDGFW